MMFDPKKDPRGAINNVACVLEFLEGACIALRNGPFADKKEFDGLSMVIGECRETLIEAAGTIKGI